jgi:hypothetical protein
MNYKIRKIKIALETAKIILFEAKTLCKIIEAIPNYDNNDTFYLDLVILERWGNVCLGYEVPDKTHKVVILRPDENFEYTPNYEPVLSRRGKFRIGTQDYYLFQV